MYLDDSISMRPVGLDLGQAKLKTLTTTTSFRIEKRPCEAMLNRSSEH